MEPSCSNKVEVCGNNCSCPHNPYNYLVPKKK
ncbi:hypothetical protein Patl1_26995 [Pistacia atlantica]|uniref:Uncharacterized protein n=1 Tax=Pistacia atlantica TaxID=434234 RepID=A0ACC1B1X4_9ROSI|nr:hypothetical protein Patl1_26995 [Pistacia atlantica]